MEEILQQLGALGTELSSLREEVRAQCVSAEELDERLAHACGLAARIEDRLAIVMMRGDAEGGTAAPDTGAAP